jgi:endonuclease/exonuclease/phosphatase family metal-dependent hydrolase
VRSLVSRNDLDILYQADQLSEQLVQGRAFPGFREFPIRFHPTYKYDNNSTQYDSSEKNRIPAWTDRVLVSGQSVNITHYERSELMLSDHRPVKALLELDVSLNNVYKLAYMNIYIPFRHR